MIFMCSVKDINAHNLVKCDHQLVPSKGPTGVHGLAEG